jgi:hypothetical protein
MNFFDKLFKFIVCALFKLIAQYRNDQNAKLSSFSVI